MDGSFECYTLEDPDGAADRIQSGAYRVIIDFSNRFQKQMPHVIGSKAIDERGIRIHSGNTEADTEGCILVGTSKENDRINGSHDAFKALFAKLQAAIASGGTVHLSIS